MENSENQNNELTTPDKPAISLRDMVLVMQILHECTKRGAWQADELSAVGGLYDRLSAFLTSAGVDVKNINSNLKD